MNVLLDTGLLWIPAFKMNRPPCKVFLTYIVVLIIPRTCMEWTVEHDVQLLIEMRASNLFSFKKGSPFKGRIWEQITETLNSVKTLKFCLKEKLGIRDRWNLLQ